MKCRGFSIVELAIVIVVIGILSSIGILRFSAMQVEARDTERRTKAENIARYLESMYSHSNGAPLVEAGTYPRASAIANSCNADCTADSTTDPWPINTAKLESLFSNDGFDIKNLQAPGATSNTFIVTKTIGTPSSAFVGNNFVYQPLAVSSSGGYTICNLRASECRAFNLYYRLESNSTVQTIMSKNR